MPTYVVTVQEPNWPCTGSLYPSAATAAATYVPQPVSSSITTGSWGGLANTWGANSSMTGSFPDSLDMGVWGNLANTWGASSLPTESIDRNNPTSTNNPNVNQSMGSGEWDPFPIPPEPPQARQPSRDTTRYRKTYSSQRLQPRRIRYIKR